MTSGRKSRKNVLASSIVLVCRKRSEKESAITRGDLKRKLKGTLAESLRILHEANIAPVDMAQASIGPGMSVYSQHKAVVEADGTTMSVRSALQLVNDVVDELSGEEEGSLDSDTRFAITWFETRGYEEGPFGDADTLARARNVSVDGVKEAGVLSSAGGRVRLLTRSELAADWSPETDQRLTVWEATQYLIRRLEEEGESGAASLLSGLGSAADQARRLLLLRLFQLATICCGLEMITHGWRSRAPRIRRAGVGRCAVPRPSRV